MQGKAGNKLKVLLQDNRILIMDQPIIKILIEFDSMMMHKLCHLHQDHREDLRSRSEVEGQNPKLIGFCQRHHETQEMLVLQMNGNMKLSIYQVDQS